MQIWNKAYCFFFFFSFLPYAKIFMFILYFPTRKLTSWWQKRPENMLALEWFILLCHSQLPVLMGILQVKIPIQCCLLTCSEPHLSTRPFSTLGLFSHPSASACFPMLSKWKVRDVYAISSARWMLIQVQSQHDVTEWLMSNCKMLPPAG